MSLAAAMLTFILYFKVSIPRRNFNCQSDNDFCSIQILTFPMLTFLLIILYLLFEQDAADRLYSDFSMILNSWILDHFGWFKPFWNFNGIWFDFVQDQAFYNLHILADRCISTYLNIFCCGWALIVYRRICYLKRCAFSVIFNLRV